MPYCRNCRAELPEDARFCPNCGVPVGKPETKPVETHRTLRVVGRPQVVIANTAPGSIEVKPGPEGEVTVDLDLSVPEDLDWSILEEGNVVTITCRVRTRPLRWPSYIFSGGPKANVLVSVPPETDLDLEARFERVTVTGIRGNIVMQSSVARLSIEDCKGTIKAIGKTGSVHLKNANGTISVRNSTGPVDLENVNGTVSVHNYTGPIRFTGALSKGENWFKTSTGSIELTLHGEHDLRVEAFTRLGRITCNPELTNARYERGVYTGQIGAGTGRLIAETTTGPITIRR